MENKKAILIVLVSFAIVIIVGFFLIRGTIRISTIKPHISGEFIQNPDFNTFPTEDVWYDGGNVNVQNNAIWYNQSIEGRSYLVLIHPKSETEVRYIEQTVSLPAGKKYHLNIGLANVQGKAKVIDPIIPIDIENVVECADNGFRVKITSSGQEKTIADLIVNAKDGWKALSYDISSYAGQTITVRVEGYAGGPCGTWSVEWGAVDYIDIVTS